MAYRQAIAAHKLVAGPDGTPLFFSKECFSNGSIGTVDVTYPSAPLFLVYQPKLLRGMLEPIFYFSESGRWTKPFAAHDVGTYPQANGQTYPHDMPVEESGNMLILTAAIAQVEGNADFAKQHWKTLTQHLGRISQEPWLRPRESALHRRLCRPPGPQRESVDQGHRRHRGLWQVGRGRAGRSQKTSAEYLALARKLAGQWVKAAADGDHYRLTFDKPGTWSQKYNLAWDRWLGLNLFPPAVAQKEIAYYLKQQGPFGLPLDSRKTYTKGDWILWTATMARAARRFRRPWSSRSGSSPTRPRTAFP